MTDEIAPETPPPPSRARRVLRKIVIVVVTLLVLLALAPFFAMRWLTSSAGGEYLRVKIPEAVHDSIAGRLETGRIDLDGLLRLVVEDVRIFAPGDTEPVIAIKRVTLDVRAAALLVRRVEITELLVEQPSLRLVQEAGTTNLERALAPKKPPAAEVPEEEKPSEPPQLFLSAPDIVIRGGRVEIVGPNPVLVEGLELVVDARGTPAEFLVKARLEAQGRTPIDRALKLAAEAVVTPTSAQITSFSLESGRSKALLSGDLAFDLSKVALAIQDLTIAAADVHAFVPEVTLLGDTTLTGTATLEGKNAGLKLQAALPSGTLALEAEAVVDLADSSEILRTYRARLTVAGVEPHKVMEGLPRSLVNADLTIDGAGLPPSSKGTVRLEAGGSRYEALPIDALVLEATLAGFEATIEKLTARTADVSLSAKGQAGPERAAIELHVAVPSLARTRTLLARGLGLELPAMDGALTLAGGMRGPYASPKLDLRATSPKLIVEGNRVEGLKATIDVGRLSARPQASFELTVDKLAAAGLDGEKLSMRGAIDGESVTSDAAGMLGGTRVELRLRGVRQAPAKPGVEKWVLSELAGKVLGLSARAERPASIEFGNGQFAVDRFNLHGDLGRLSLSARGGLTGPIAADFSVTGLRIDKVPKALLPPDLGLGGLATISAQVTGTLDAPVIDAKASVTDGRYGTFRPVGMNVHAHVADNRAAANVRVNLPASGLVTLNATMPLASPEAQLRAPRPEEIDAALSFERIDVALLQQLAPDATALQGFAGRLLGSMTVKGTWAAPVARARVRLAEAKGFGLDRFEVSLEADYLKGALTTTTRVTNGEALGAKLEIATTLDSAALLRGVRPDFMTLPLESKLTLDTLDLAWLAKLHFLPETLVGRLAGTLQATGTAQVPIVTGTLAATSVDYGGYRNLDAILELKAFNDMGMSMLVRVAGKDLLRGDVSLKIAPWKVAELKPSELFEVPFTLALDLLPTPLERLMPRDRRLKSEEAELVRGTASASLRASGTAEKPSLALNGRVDDVTTSGQNMGKLSFDLGYVDEKTTVNGVFHSAGAGDLVIRATMPGSLAASEVIREGAALLDREAALQVDADQFDLALANGFVPGVREIAGKLDLHLRKSGPLSSPAMRGSLTVASAHAALLEYGELSDVNVDAELAWPKVTIKRFSGRSGRGTFSATAEAGSDDGGRKIKGAMTLDVNNIPLVQSYQTRAYLTMKVQASGTLEDNHLRVPELRISKGFLKIPERLQKGVQALEPHPDIVFAGKQGEKIEAAKAAEKAAATEGDFRATVRIVIPNDFQIDAPLGSNLTLGARLDVRVDPDLARDGGEPLDVVGEVRIVRGVISLIRRFEVQKGAVTFFPRNWTDPTLEVRAKHESSGTTVFVDITGTASEPKQTFSAKPAMLESEILYFLATGQKQTRAQSEAVGLDARFADAGLSLLGSAAAGVLKGAVEKLLPKAAELDVLSIETDVAKRSFGKIRAGKFFTERFYIGTQYNAAADPAQDENVFEVEGEFRLGENTYLKGRGGDTNRYNVELTFEKNIKTKAQQGGAKP